MKAEVYTKPDCPHCVNAKQLLQNKGFDFVEFKIGTEITREEFLEKFPDTRKVPQIIIEGTLVGGYDQLREYFAT